MPIFSQLEVRISPKTDKGYPVRLVVDEKRHLAQGISPLEWPHAEGAAAEVGRRLLEWLCHDHVIADAWAQLRDQPRSIRLNIQAPELAAWPWESLREAAMPLAASDLTPLSRYCETHHPKRVARNLSTLRLLVAIAAPDDIADYQLTEIDAAKEQQAFELALADTPIELRFVTSPLSLASLEQALIQEQPDILHIVAHGKVTKKGYVTLYFANDKNDTALVSESDFAAMLQRRVTALPDMVFLSVCESGEVAQRGVATALMQTAGVPTVLAMQGLISMNSARRFSQRFYQRLLAHGQVDLACNEARSHLLSLSAWDSYLPVLYSRLDDNRLFWLGEAAKTPAHFTARYGATLADTLNEIQLFGVEQVVKHERDPRRKYPLSVAYITLQVEAEARREPDPLPRSAEWQAASSLQRALAEYPRLLIQGPAGSGKSTLLKWLAIQLGQGTLDGLLAEWRSKIPFFIRLRRCYDKLPTVQQFIGLELPDLACEMPSPDWANQILKEGQGVVLIDGLDEVAESWRGKVLAWLDGLARQFPGNRFIVTSRPLWQEGTEANPLADFGYELARLQPMNMAYINEFVEHWHAAVAEQIQRLPANKYQPLAEDLPTLQQHLLQQIGAQTALQELAATPLLCAMLCVLNQAQEGQPLPLKRTKLYQDCIELLLEKRDREREIPIKLGLNLEQRFMPLRRLAYRWLEEGQLEQEASWVETILRSELRHFSSKVALDMTEVLQFLAERSGLLQSVGLDKLTFVHKSFQEYLAAQYAVEEAMVTPLVERSHDQNWRQVILLYMSLTTPRLATQFFRQLLAAKPSRAQLYLALACVAERPSLDPEIEAQLRQLFEAGAIVPPHDEEERDILVGVGHLCTPYLGWHERYEEWEVAYCIEALGQIGGELAYQGLKNYAHDKRDLVRYALLEAWDNFDRVQFAREILVVNWTGKTELWYQYVSHLEGIEQLAWLTEVELGHDRVASFITDINLLKMLPQLQSLRLRFMPQVTDLTVLRYLPHLQSLELKQMSQISDLTVLQELPQLQSLGLWDMSQMSDLMLLQELPQLQALTLGHMPQINDLTILRQLKQLQLLRLWYMFQINDFAALQQLPQLQSLSLVDMHQIKDLSVLRQLQVQSLRLMAIPLVNDISPLRELPKLQSLTLFAINQVSNLTPLNEVLQLQSLSLQDMPHVNDFMVLRELQRLQSLKLGFLPKITNITLPKDLPYLQSLSLDNLPQVTDIQLLQELPQLQSLTLWRMPQLINFDFLLDMPALQQVEFRLMPQARAWRDSLPPDVGFEVVIID